MSFSIESHTELARLTTELKRGARLVSINGLTSIAAKAFVLAALKQQTDKTCVIVTDSNKDSDTWECDLDFWSRKKNFSLLNLPSFESDVYANISPHAETLEKRALALWNLTKASPDFLLASAKALITKTLAPGEIKNLGAHLRRDEDFAPERLIETLVASGYVREEPLRNVGEFSVRGGILDVWSPDAEMPVRIEFFGDTIDSIRQFDAETQLSTEQLKETSIAPMREFSATAKDFRDWSFFASSRFSDEKFARALKDRTQFADEGEDFAGWEFLFPLVNPRESNVFDFLENYILVIDEPALVEQTLSVFYENLDNRFAEITETGEIGLEPRELFLSGEELRGKFETAQRAELRALGRSAAATDEQFQFQDSSDSTIVTGTLQAPKKPLFLFSTAEKSVEFEIGSRSTRKYHGNVKDFAEQFKVQGSKLKAENQSDQRPTLRAADRWQIVLQSHGLAERLSEILRDYDVSIPDESLLVGDLSGGFEIPALRLIVHTETDIFGETTQAEFQKSKPQKTKKSNLGAFISDFRDLKAGDFGARRGTRVYVAALRRQRETFRSRRTT
jgi:transcription-repair coupling factor (superfamily II helicase)